MAKDPAYSRRLLLSHGLGAAMLLPAAALADRPRSARKTQPSLPLVMIDPGHGGKDPGAIGVRGTYEKHVSFATAEELARQLYQGGRVRPMLTRTRDVFVPLDERVGMAERLGATLFVSLHADALADHAVRGASVYTLAANASDAQSAALAASENAADRFGASGTAGVSPEIAGILTSLVRHETRIGSARLQRQAVASLAATRDMLEHPSRRAGFAVLKSSAIPSILVEMGFMSNPEDEAALCTERHRAMLAGAMRRSIETYLAAGSMAASV
jgi:N-acetylmuramoyl-L-alanine amidase